MLEVGFNLNLRIFSKTTDLTSVETEMREAKTDMPGDSAGRPRKSFVKRLLSQLAPGISSEGPLPAVLSSQGCFALSRLRGKLPTQSSLPLMLMGALGSLLPSPPTSLAHVPSLHSLLCQIALTSAFSPPFLFSLHIFSVGGLTGLLLSSACPKIPLLKSCSEQELVFCSVNEASSFLSTGRLHEHTSCVKHSKPRPSMSCPPFQPFTTLLSDCSALLCFLLLEM